MNIRKLYYTMKEDDFHSYLNQVKTDPSAVSVLSDTFFCYPDQDLNDRILQIHKSQKDFDSVISTFSDFAQKQIIQSYLINEIQSTNRIENIHSTRHDIFLVMNKVRNSSDKHIQSVVNSYMMLLSENNTTLNGLQNLRTQYDLLMKDAFEESSDRPDGEFFRRKPVIISDGLKTIHNGFYPEEKINEGMRQFLKIYNNGALDIYLRLILSHFILETVHPFYDGNGRFGRYLISRELFRQEKSYTSFLIASSIHNQKNRYYKAFRTAEDIHAYGCLNPYSESLLQILSDGFNLETKNLKEKELLLQSLKAEIPDDIKKSERCILTVLQEASVFTFYGISTDEIMEQTSLSKRTVIYALNDLRKRNLLVETKFGRITYRKALIPEKS